MMDKTAISVGGPILAAKIGPAGPILAEKLVWGTSFGRFFCQNRSGWTDFSVTVLLKQILGISTMQSIYCKL